MGGRQKQGVIHRFGERDGGDIIKVGHKYDRLIFAVVLLQPFDTFGTVGALLVYPLFFL